ncbi:MAG TPA: adenine deaminase [Desulfosalsimonadaceae bacterium]|nr:adenine deaminase [Desulfosalsimonadaceae bacterium]
MQFEGLIQVAGGERPADLLLTNARVVNVFSGAVEARHIAIADGYIAGFGDYEAIEKVDLEKRLVTPGFIDAHVHIESSMTAVSEFVRAVLPRGTTTVVVDPHEIANVMGASGISYMIAEAAKQPMNIFFALPSCVPATDRETAGARLDAADLAPFWQSSQVVALGEMMNFPGVISGSPGVLEKIAQAAAAGRPVDGHGPGLSGKALCAYIAAGIASDHECVSLDEAEDKLARGMHIMIREGSGAKNLDALLPLVTPDTAHRLMWCTDDRHPHDILQEGHIDAIVRRAVAYGVDPALAIRIASLTPASYFHLPRIGAVAPGMRADLVVAAGSDSLFPEQVYAGGRLVAANGRMCPEVELPRPGSCSATVQVDCDNLNFQLRAAGTNARVIDILAGQLVTGQAVLPVRQKDGMALADSSADIAKIAVVERHHGTGNIGTGFVRGFGVQKGALASSVAHDSHNIIVIGADDRDMQAAAAHVASMQGGLCVVCEQDVQAELALPIAGLMSGEPLDTVSRALDGLTEAARRLGCRLEDPFMTLSFLALPVIPELKITDQGLFDVQRFTHVPVFVD